MDQEVEKEKDSERYERERREREERDREVTEKKRRKREKMKSRKGKKGKKGGEAQEDGEEKVGGMKPRVENGAAETGPSVDGNGQVVEAAHEEGLIIHDDD